MEGNTNLSRNSDKEYAHAAQLIACFSPCPKTKKKEHLLQVIRYVVKDLSNVADHEDQPIKDAFGLWLLAILAYGGYTEEMRQTFGKNVAYALA